MFYYFIRFYYREGEGGGGREGEGGVKLHILGKNPQVHLILQESDLKIAPPPLILRNFDNFPRSPFYSNPLP